MNEKKGLPGAAVAVSQLIGDRRVRRGSAVVTKDGSFSLKGLPAGAYQLTASAPGFATSWRVLWILPGLNQAPVVALRRSATIAGTVVDERRQPIRGITVRATPAAAPLDSRRVPYQIVGQTGPDGAFVLDGLPRGAHRVQASGEGYLSAESQVVAPSRDVALRLVRLHTVEGLILGGQGSGAVRIVGSGIWPSRTVEARKGHFRIERVPEGIYELVAWSKAAPWRASEVMAGIAVGPGLAPPVVLVLRPAQRIIGEVVGAGKPVANAVVALGRLSLSVLRYRVRTNSRGQFELPPVLLGRHQLGVWAPGFVPQSDRTLKLPLPNLPLRIELSRGAVISGQVVDKQGLPVPGALVRTIYRAPKSAGKDQAVVGELGVVPGPVPPIPLEGGASRGAGQLDVAIPLSSAQTDSSGRYRLSGLLPGELRVQADHPDYASARSGWLTLTADAPPQTLGSLVMVKACTIEGRVVDERAMPLGHARISERSTRRGGGQEVFSAADGSFTLRGLTGRVTLTAAAAGYLPSTRRLKLDGRLRVTLELLLEPAREWVSGHVRDPGQNPISGARVQVRQGASHQVEGLTDSAGFFLLKGFGRRKLEVEVSRAGYITVTRNARPKSRLELRLAYQAAVQGFVQERRTGAPITRFTVMVQGKGRGAKTRVVDPQGRFKLTAVTPGRVVLRVASPGYATEVLRLKVGVPRAPGELTVDRVKVALRRAGSITGQVTDLIRGRPVAGAKVRVGPNTTTTGANGRFKLEGVPEGQVRVEIRAGARSLRSDPISVRGGETAGPLRLMLR